MMAICDEFGLCRLGYWFVDVCSLLLMVGPLDLPHPSPLLSLLFGYIFGKLLIS